jgi:multidrug resistance efflux pump
VTVAIPLIALSGWCLLPFALVPVSSLAVVNARLSRMRSPVTGEALQTPLEAGDSVKLDEEIVQLRTSTPLPVDTNPAEIERSRKDLTAQAASTDGQILAAQQRLKEYETALREYSSRMSGEVNIRMRDAEHAVAAAQESCARAEEELKRSEQLEKEGLRAASFSAEARRKLAIEQRELDARKTAFEQLKVQTENLKAGYFVGQGVEQPRYLALRDETRAELGKLQRDREVLKIQLKSADHDMVTTLAKPQETVAKNLVVIKSPVNGVIWSREVSAGQAVNETDDLFQVADSGSLHVDAWVDRRYGPQLSIGDEALVYLTGNGKQLIGRVVAIQASSHRRLDEFTTAIDLQPPHPDQYRVIIQLDAADRNVTYLGQSAKVMFPGPRASMAARFYFWVTHL